MSGIMNMLLGARTAIAVAVDEFFNLTTLLLPGNGTNGAQNNTFLDSSTNNFTITRNGNTTQGTFSPFSQTGWSNFFSGSGTYLTATQSAFVATGDFTCDVWYWQNNQTSGFQGIVSTAAAGGTTGIRITTDNGTLTIWLNNSSVTVASAPQNQWNHVAISRTGTGSNNVSCYLNGTRVGQLTNTGSTTNSSLTIGRYYYDTADYYINGYISNVRLVVGSGLYSGATITVPTAPLAAVSGTQLLTCQSNRFVDNSSNAFALTVTGTPSVQPFSPFLPTAAYSALTVGGSGYFDGTGDSLSVANNSALSITGNVDASIEFWVYPISGSGVVVNKSGVSGSVFPNYSVSVNSNGSISFFLGNSGSPGSAVTTITTSAGTVPFNAWSHVVCTKTYVGGGSVNNYRVMINGILSNNGTQNNASDGNPGALTIGFEPSSTDDINAYISQLRIFNTSIPAAYQTSSTTNGTSIYTVPTTPITASTSSICTLFTNAGITDATAKNVLETLGNAQISTTQSKFGGSSMSFDGSGDYLTSNPATTDLYAFGSGDFTIEMWLRLNSVTGTQVFYDQRPLAGGVYPTLYMSGSTLFYYANGANRITGSNLSTNQWYHIAVSRSGTSTRLFVDGTQSGSTYTDTNVYLNAALRPFIGGDGTNIGSGGVNGFIDDLRITRFARYTANFTAPTTAFPLQ
jgi:hypothetical protein